MTLNELEIAIIELKKEYGGDTNVRLSCDHGQELMSATWIGLSYISDDAEYLADEISEDDIHDYEGEYTKIIQIQAY